MRIIVLVAMLRDGTFYESEPHASLDEGQRGTAVNATVVPLASCRRAPGPVTPTVGRSSRNA